MALMPPVLSENKVVPEDGFGVHCLLFDLRIDGQYRGRNGLSSYCDGLDYILL